MTETRFINQGAVLVIGAGTSDALAFRAITATLGNKVIGTSTLAVDPARDRYDAWIDLPSIYDARFLDCLDAAVCEHDVSVVFGGSGAVHEALTRLVGSLSRPVRVASRDFVADATKAVHDLYATVALLREMIADVCAPAMPPSDDDLVADLRYGMTVFGESGPTKLLLLSGLLASAPEGDVVEIGVLMGRSAAVLACGAARYNKTSLITVDPWTVEHAMQGDSNPMLQDRTLQLDTDGLCLAFRSALGPVGGQRHVHLRKPSVAASEDYASGEPISGYFGGSVRPAGKIALIHIDGNHDYACVREDCQKWLRHLGPGAWAVLDDYVWMHGDGPKRVGDELLATGVFERAFVCDKALFLKTGPSLDGLADFLR